MLLANWLSPIWNMVIRFRMPSGLEILGLPTKNSYGGHWDLGPTWNYAVMSDRPFLVDAGRFGQGLDELPVGLGQLPEGHGGEEPGQDDGLLEALIEQAHVALAGLLQRSDSRDFGGDGVLEGYEVDDQTRTQVREAAVTRWSGFLNDNRSNLQPLLNEFIETRLQFFKRLRFIHRLNCFD